jgi:hypothetical protein
MTIDGEDCFYTAKRDSGMVFRKKIAPREARLRGVLWTKTNDGVMNSYVFDVDIAL